MNVTAPPWATLCTPPPPTCSVVQTPFVSGLSDTLLPQQEVQPLGFSLLSNNIGGLKAKESLIADLFTVLDPSVIMLQETWDNAAAAAVLPDRYRFVVGTSDGPGTGFVTAWHSFRQIPETESSIVYDDRDGLAVTVPFEDVGLVLLVSLHCHPQASYREVKAALQLVGALEERHTPALTWVAGDLNVSLSNKHPLYWAVTSESGPLARFDAVLPKDTATHFTHRKGVPVQTSIDHAYVRGPIEDVTHLLVHTGSEHRGVLASLSLPGVNPDPFHWKRYRWGATHEQDLVEAYAALNLVWGLMALSTASPLQYLRAAHHTFQQFVRMPISKERRLQLVRRPKSRLAKSELEEYVNEVRSMADDLKVQRRLDTLKDVSITSHTRPALRLHAQPLAPFKGILPEPGAVLRTVDECA